MRFQDPRLERHGKHWRVRVWVPIVTKDGEVTRQRQSVFLGKIANTTEKAAKQKRVEMLAQLNGNPLVVQSQLRFSTLIEKFETVRLPQLASTTRAKYESHIKNHVRPGFGAMQLIDIGRSTIEAWLETKRQSGLSQATRTDLRNLVGSMFHAAAEWRLWNGNNPASKANVGRGGPVREPRKLADRDLQRFLGELQDTAVATAETARLITLTAIAAGLRISEVLGLQPGDIDPDSKTLTIRRRLHRGDVDQTKTKASRRVRYIGRLADELIAKGMRPRKSGDAEFLFLRPDGDMLDDRDLQQHVWRPAAERAGSYFPGFGIHHFRRLSITWRQEEGATPVEAMRQAGHTRMATTMMYTLTDEAREKAVVDRIMDRINPPAKGLVS
jgi:integrase